MDKWNVTRDRIKNALFWSSHCGAMGSVVSWEHGTQVWSLAQHSGLNIQHCCSSGLGHNFGLDLIPGLRIPCATGQPKMKKKKKKNALFWSSLVVQQVKDLALSLQWLSSLLWRGLDPWSRDQGAQPKQKYSILSCVVCTVESWTALSDIETWQTLPQTIRVYIKSVNSGW